jgi:IS1 family transposase
MAEGLIAPSCKLGAPQGAVRPNRTPAAKFKSTTIVLATQGILHMNQLSTAQRARIISCLVEGCSLRSTVRMTGAAKRTVARLQVEIGEACAKFHDKFMVNLPCKRIQVDEIWAFTYCKQANIPEALKGLDSVGDTWTWVAIDPDSKLIPSWYVGKRDASAAYFFIHDLQKRLASRVQLTSDGLKAYLEAVEDAFGAEVDYAMLIKLYGNEGLGAHPTTEVRYSPPVCIGAKKTGIIGNPNPHFVSTSHVERQNLTMRMSSRRFTRLTNAFSKKFENHKHAVALHFTHYNFCRIHQTLRVTPAMAAGISDHVWELSELVALLK